MFLLSNTAPHKTLWAGVNMENNFFIFNDKDFSVEFERFHICTWEFKNNTALVEFGGELSSENDYPDDIALYLYLPWLTSSMERTDLYERLKDPENSKFIFNDAIESNIYIDGGVREKGVVHRFSFRDPLCILPVILDNSIEKENILKILINTRMLKEKLGSDNKTHIYFRISVNVDLNLISTRKTGISKSSILYDLKINERRNLPTSLNLQEKVLSKIKNCFCFNVIPNTYELSFFDRVSLKNIRTLEYDPSFKYLGDKRIRKDEYIVVFNKQKGEESYSFFSVYTKERIGTGQFALAMLVSIISGFLLFIPSFKLDNHVSFFSSEFWSRLPLEVYISLSIGLSIFFYFVWPTINKICKLFGKLGKGKLQ
ncbi:hypothetical protein KKF34_01280 [Myxococcota bacterium]|nr:hypothetical protein [Myxococcota bacterium]MBU1381951.1 hypothetical protein [Myxococcota bacterium]MBU1495493.1 hypothetical protein [Myxococcota bacterium]